MRRELRVASASSIAMEVTVELRRRGSQRTAVVVASP
jgi:hypothetical protein